MIVWQKNNNTENKYNTTSGHRPANTPIHKANTWKTKKINKTGEHKCGDNFLLLAVGKGVGVEGNNNNNNKKKNIRSNGKSAMNRGQISISVAAVVGQE